jgi:lactate permease
MSPEVWSQGYDPLHNPILSTLLAAAPLVVLLGTLGILRLKAHWAAILALSSAIVVAVFAFKMPGSKAVAAASYGAGYGLLPIGWIILNVLFLYNLTNSRGLFKVLRESLTAVTQDRRLQVLLIAFCFGAFFEGAAGFGTPVAVGAAMLIGLGFSPLAASGLALIGNTAPCAFAALGIPITTLAAVTGLDQQILSAMVGRQLAIFTVIVPFWLVWAFAGWRGTLEIWPAVLLTGVSFAIPMFLVSNYHGPMLVNLIASLTSLGALVTLLLVWRPRRIWGLNGHEEGASARGFHGYTGGEVFRAWLPWIILTSLVFVWGLPQVKKLLDGVTIKCLVPHLHLAVCRVPPAVAAVTPEKAEFTFNWLSTTGTGILLAAIIAGLVMGFGLRGMLSVYWSTLKQVRFSLLTVAAMMAIGFVTRYAGLDVTLGVAFAKTGRAYPFFGSLLGWLGVALTGSDTGANALFGGLQCITAKQIGVSAVLMAAGNSSGGVMGKMINAQSIVVASTATGWYGQEGRILRYVFLHSVVLAALMGVLVLLQAYAWPFTRMVVG